MPAAVAIPLITAAVTAGTSIAGAKMSSSAAKKAGETQAASAERAAQLQTEAANHAADLQAKAAAEALAYQKEQAQLDAARAEAAQRGNYDQWAAQQRRVSTLGEMLGLGARQIPAYVKGPSTIAETMGTPPPRPTRQAPPLSADPTLRAILASQQQAPPIAEIAPPVELPRPVVRPRSIGASFMRG